ncbi:DUF6221 family protein [Actinomadura fibrosa]|uniref:DUF6221 family protein n=1 Tax=Actinomadura fibrosa TaxID=111802 RepID=A0ABW2XNL3_9ACTN|nr:DUF6221 family protein [Actinomadura fibrosa]
MSDLTDFITDRLDVDEEAARDALARTTTRRHRLSGQTVHVPDRPADWGPDAVWPPERVLADVGAKRRIVALHPHTTMRREIGEEHLRSMYGPNWERRLIHLDDLYCRTCHVADGKITNDAGIPCLTLRLLALPYADHPAYRDEWRP